MTIIILKLSLAEKLPTIPNPLTHPHTRKKKSFHWTSNMIVNGGKKKRNLWKYWQKSAFLKYNFPVVIES